MPNNITMVFPLGKSQALQEISVEQEFSTQFMLPMSQTNTQPPVPHLKKQLYFD